MLVGAVGGEKASDVSLACELLGILALEHLELKSPGAAGARQRDPRAAGVAEDFRVPVGVLSAFEVDDQPGLFVGIAFHLDSKPGANGAASAVASGEVADGHSLGLAIG